MKNAIEVSEDWVVNLDECKYWGHFDCRDFIVSAKQLHEIAMQSGKRMRFVCPTTANSLIEFHMRRPSAFDIFLQQEMGS